VTSAGLRVQIRLPPAQSPQTFGPSRAPIGLHDSGNSVKRPAVNACGRMATGPSKCRRKSPIDFERLTKGGHR
jgi:hypothetical protein